MGAGDIGRRGWLALALAGLAGTTAWPTGARPPARPAPDLTGLWTHAWYTHLQRPPSLKTLVVTTGEAVAYEAPRRAHQGELITAKDAIGQNESEFPDNGPGLARIRGERRSSWITDPVDGRVPWTEAARKKLNIGGEAPEGFDNVEARPTHERCLTANGSGAPLLNSHDANLIQIVQGRDAVLIVTEKNHEARIVRLADADGRPARPDEAANWYGVSVGRWDGATLVVETTRLRPGLTRMADDLWLSDRSRVIERFTRTGPAEIAYRFEVEDPTLFTRPWRGEMVFRAAEGQMYEFACHEGNYSLPSILAAARQGNQAPAAEPAKGGK